MEYGEQLVREFAYRTKANLLAIERLDKLGEAMCPDGKVFPFTQLCNSLLGLVLLPKEWSPERLPETPLRDLQQLDCVLHKMNWQVKHTSGAKKGQLKCQTFRELAVVLRHAIAHFNIEVIGKNGQIVGVKMWNYPNREAKRANQKDFEIELSEAELRHLALVFIEVLHGDDSP
jgi:hypothetical protein